jgi:putative membrane protein
MKTLTLGLALLLSTPAAFAAEPAKPADAAAAMMKVATPDFAKQVMSSDQFEIRSSQMAETKAEAADVKAFAAEMIADHQKAGTEFKAALGKSGGASAPAAPEIAPKHAAMLKQLEAANGADFQTLYIDMQAQAHREAVALFRTYAGSGEDAAVVSFAKETLPVLEKHMMHVTTLVKAH